MLLGLDLGTSSAKAALVEEDGTLVAWAAAPIPTRHPEPGAAEQDPVSWLEAIATAVAQLPRRPGAAGVRAVGLAGQLPTLCVLGSSGELVGPAITWEDERASALVARLVDAEYRRELWRRSGMPLDGRYLLPMARQHYSAALASGARICSAKDWVLRELTGELATDQTTAPGYGCYDLERNAWDPMTLELFEVDPGALPPIVAATDAVALGAAGADLLGLVSGTPVAVGGGDALTAALELCRGGRAGIVAGTSGVVLVPAGWEAWEVLEVPVLANRAVLGEGLVLEADQLVTSGVLDWAGTLLGLGTPEVVELAASTPARAGAVLVAAYLAGGEQGVLWRDDVAGAALGLTLATTRGELARAVVEGVAFELRRMLEAVAPGTQRVRIGGGMAAWPALLPLLADAMGVVLEARETHALTARAAAVVGGFASGTLGIDDAAEALERPRWRVVEPDPVGMALEAERFARWVELFPERARWGWR